MTEPSHREAYAELAVLDATVVAELRQLDSGNPGVLPGLIARFIAREELFLADPKLRPDALDLGFLRANAHRIKGSASAFGACGLAECAARLERAAGHGDVAETKVLIDHLRAQFAQAVLRLVDVYGVKP